MAEGNGRDLDLLHATGDQITAAINRGVRAALREHKAAGRSIVVWRDGQVVHLRPDEYDVPDEPAADTCDATPTNPAHA